MQDLLAGCAGFQALDETLVKFTISNLLALPGGGQFERKGEHLVGAGNNSGIVSGVLRCPPGMGGVRIPGIGDRLRFARQQVARGCNPSGRASGWTWWTIGFS